MFSLDLEYNVVYLEDARSVVMTSFFSRKSISHLDLQISEIPLYFTQLDSRLFCSKKRFFCTEESFRNNVVPERKLLYSLNLDLPEGREYSNLRSGSAPADFLDNSGSLFIAVRGYDNFFRDVLINLISSCERSDYKLKWLKWMDNFPPLQSACLPISVQNFCAEILYRDCVDSAFTMKFFEKFIDLYTFSCLGDLKILEHLLYTARIIDFKIKDKMIKNSSLTDCCIKHLGCRVVQSILKYEDTVYYTDGYYEALKKSIFDMRDARILEELNHLENWMSKSRLYRIMQIILVFICDDGENASEALRLVWSSIPDPYVPLQEMNMTFGQVLPWLDFRQAHRFYEKAICQSVSHRAPRSLTQYCRTNIRRILCNSKQWLPDGIKQLKLPSRFKSFLNLQKDDIKPDNFGSS